MFSQAIKFCEIIISKFKLFFWQMIILGFVFPALASAVTPMVAAGYNNTMALKSDGTVVACGWNTCGQLGDGTRTDSSSPVSVPRLNLVTSTGGITPLPDLVVSAMTSPSSSAQSGGTVSVTATVTNQGSAAAGASWLQYYLSSDNLITPFDTDTTWGCSVPALAAGASYNGCSGPIAVPNVITGSYYFGAIADGLGAVIESNENNNSLAASSPTQITGTAATLPTCILTATPGTISAGGTSILTASCSPAATSYLWVGGTCVNTSWAICTVTPSATTTYTVAGVNSTGSSAVSAVTVTVATTVAGQVVEFYNANLDNYFITADSNEAAQIDGGAAGPGWSRTGYTFKSGGTTSVCRFYGSYSPGPNSHFYTVDPAECQGLYDQQIPTGDPRKLTTKSWNFESLDFVSTAPTTTGVNGTCPTGTTPVYRAYNKGFSRGVDSNHRITSSLTAINEVVTRGWSNEGVVMCAPSGTGTAPYIISGTVAIGQPVEGARVCARTDDLESATDCAITDARGGFVLPLWIQPPWHFKAEKTIGNTKISLFSLSYETGGNITVNITPITDVITRVVAYDETGDTSDNSVWNNRLSGKSGKVEQIKAGEKTMLGGMADNTDPVSTPFVPDPVVSVYDRNIENTQVAFDGGDVTVSDVNDRIMATAPITNIVNNSVSGDTQTVTQAEADAARVAGDYKRVAAASSCISPQVLQSDGTCATPPPTRCISPEVLSSNGVCYAPSSSTSCTSSQVLLADGTWAKAPYGSCWTPSPTNACASPQVLQNLECVTPTQTCTSPQVLQNGVCVTPAPTGSSDWVGYCHTPPPSWAPERAGHCYKFDSWGSLSPAMALDWCNYFDGVYNLTPCQ